LLIAARRFHSYEEAANGVEDDACRDTDAPAELEAETASSQGDVEHDLRLVVALEADDAPFKPPKTATRTTMFKSEKTDLRKNVGAANKVRTPAYFPAFLTLREGLSPTHAHLCLHDDETRSLAHSEAPLVSENTVMCVGSP
jgi:hypothetical protein